MTDAIQTISASEGMGSDLRPSIVLSACEVKRKKERKAQIDLALAISNLILGGFSKDFNRFDAVKHLFTEDEIADFQRRKEEQEEEAAMFAQIEMLRRLSHG